MRTLAESGTNSGGNETVIPLDAASLGRSPVIVEMVVPNELARSWRVSLGAPIAETPVANVIAAGVFRPVGFPDRVANVDLTLFAATCNLQWGVGGAQFEALIDWRNGGSFVVHGSTVRVRVNVSPTANVPGFPTAAGRMKYSAMITPDDSPSPHSAPPSLTFFMGDITPGNNVSVPVPAFARTVVFYQASQLDPPLRYRVDFLTTIGGQMLSSVIVDIVGTSTPLSEIPIPANARWLVVTNLDGLETTPFVAEFRLDLG